MSEEKKPTSLIVIGGGPGGYVAAIRAAQLGAKVTLIEKAELGGTCLNRGCMPTKAMLHASEAYETANSNAAIGVLCSDVKLDWQRVQSTEHPLLQLTSGVAALVRMNNIQLVNATAAFSDGHTVIANEKEYTADKIIISSGSTPITPNIPGLKDCGAVIDSTACLELDHIPKSLLVIGGGVIGLELGTVYRRCGTAVTVVEMLPKLLLRWTKELSGMLECSSK